MDRERPRLRFFGQKVPAGGAPMGEGAWMGHSEGGVTLRVAGNEAGPHPALAATLWQLAEEARANSYSGVLIA